jgi:hypothetical protein
MVFFFIGLHAVGSFRVTGYTISRDQAVIITLKRNNNIKIAVNVIPNQNT